jgi:heterodisulfide reductase subunit B
VVYTIAAYANPGGSAKDVTYYDRYYCSVCLAHRYERLSVTTDTYQNILFNATSAPADAKLE